MNRLQFGPLALMDSSLGETQHNPLTLAAAQAAAARAAAAKIAQTDRTTQRLFIPAGYEKNYAYPLLIFLHDDHQNAGALHRIMPEISVQNYVGAAFTSPCSQRLGGAWSQDERGIADSLDGMEYCLQNACQRLNVNTEKVFLVGAGSGGQMALRLALTCPEKVAGVISLNGELPNVKCLLGRLKFARSVPLFLAHYRTSGRYTEQALCENLLLLHSGGFSVTMRQYPCDDLGCRQVFRDLNQWVMEVVTGS
jgi:phospholipase/carboxylesterase